MRDFALVTYDGENYRITEEQARKATEMRDAGKSIEFKEYPGRFIMPGTVKSIGPIRSGRSDEGQTSLSLLASDLFLPKQEGGGSFWQGIVEANMARKKDGKPWVFNRAVEWAKRESGMSDPAEVMKFVEAEWNSAKVHNVSRI